MCPFIIAIVMKHSLCPVGELVLSIKCCIFLASVYALWDSLGFRGWPPKMTHSPKLISEQTKVSMNQVFLLLSI